MTIIDTHKWKKRTERVLKKFTHRSLILMYHRVAAKGIDPWALAVTPEHFEQQMEVIKKHAQPISLLDLSLAHQAGEVPERAVAVTFDDGYANNLIHAAPILKKHKIPATVFVASGYSNKNREYWWDELDHIIFKPGTLPERLQLKLANQSFDYPLGQAVHYTEQQQRQDYESRAWKAKPHTRMGLYKAVWEVLQPLKEAERQNAMDQIIAWAGFQPTPRQSHRPMTLEELRQFEESNILSIGAHTVHHPFLSAHHHDIQQREIMNSKKYLEDILNHPIKTFAYPFGNFNKQTLKLVEKAGFTCACATVEETVWRWSDRFRMPRFEVLDWEGHVFEKKLLDWLENE